MKKCEVDNCNENSFGRDRKTGIRYCKRHQYLRTDAKSLSRTTLKKKSVLTTTKKRSAVISTVMTHRRKLTKELDNLFSELIRRTGSDKLGINKCYTCGYTTHWKNLHCGHYFSRRYFSIRWDINNAKPQCPECNITKHGNLKVYKERLINEIGNENYNRLVFAKNNFKLDNDELEQLLYYYKEKLIFINNENPD